MLLYFITHLLCSYFLLTCYWQKWYTLASISHFSSMFISNCCQRLKIWSLFYSFVEIRLIIMSVFSEKQALTIPEELFDAAAHQGVTTVNFSKNQLTSIPSRYTHKYRHSHTPLVALCTLSLLWRALTPFLMCVQTAGIPIICVRYQSRFQQTDLLFSDLQLTAADTHWPQVLTHTRLFCLCLQNDLQRISFT